MSPDWQRNYHPELIRSFIKSKGSEAKLNYISSMVYITISFSEVKKEGRAAMMVGRS